MGCHICYGLPLGVTALVKLFPGTKPYLTIETDSFAIKATATIAPFGLTALTVLVAKKIFLISLCGPNGISFGRVAVVSLAALPFSLLYVAIVNLLINQTLLKPKKKECCHNV